MYLTSSNLVHYLVGRGTIARSSVVEGDFEVHELDGRNRCFKVLRKNDPSLFVKQIKVVDDLNVQCLEREATCYRLAASDPRFAALAKLTPRFIDYDAARFTVIVELLPDSEDLRDCHRRLGSFPVEIARALGRGLGALHSTVGGEFAASADVAVLSKETPWILSVHHSTDREAGTDGTLTRIVREDHDWQLSLDSIRQAWQCETLIHGDLKWDNCIVFPDAAGRPAVRLVDWEMAGFGDAAWDVGSVFQAYWSIAILTALREQPTIPAKVSEVFESGIDSVRPAVREFWQAYVSARQWSAASVSDHLSRCVRCGATRMMQTTFEYAAAIGQVNDRALALFHVSRDLLRDSPRGVSEFLGPAARA
jgi:hypothetical protein